MTDKISITELYADIFDLDATTAATILHAVVGACAGHCVRVHYDTPQAQAVFDKLSSLIATSPRTIR